MSPRASRSTTTTARAARRRIAACAALAAAGCIASARRAMAQTWTADTGGTLLWSNASNWSGALPVSSGTTRLIFNGSNPLPYIASNNLVAPFRLNQLTLNSSAQDQIAGSALQFEADPNTAALPQVIQSGSNNFTIAAPLVLNADTTFGGGTNAGASLTLLGPISGSGAYVQSAGLAVAYGKSGTNATADATFTGGAKIQGGTLDLWGGGSSQPAFGTGQIQLTGAAALTVHNTNNATWTINNAIRVDGSATLRSERGSAVKLAGDVTLNGTLSGNTLSFAPGARLLIDNGTTGTRSLVPGSAPLASSWVIGATIADTNNVVSPNPLHLRAGPFDTLVTGTGNTYAGGTIIESNTWSSSTYVSVDQSSSLGLGNVTVQNGARLRLGAATNLAPGKTVLVQDGAAVEFNSSTLPFNNAAIALIDPASTGMLLLTSTPAPGLSLVGHEQLFLGTLTSAQISTTYTPGAGGYKLVTQNGGTLTVQAAVPAAPVLTGPYAFTAGIAGFNGTIYLKTPNDYSGGTTVNGGTLYASSNSLGAGNVNLPAGALYTTGSNAIGAGAALVVNGGQAYLSYSNGYTHGTVINSGRVTAYVTGALGSGSVTASGGVLEAAAVLPNDIRLTGDASLEGQTDPGAALAGTITLVGSRTLYSRNDLLLAGNLVRNAGDNGSLHLSTTGTLRIGGGANTYAGGTSIDGHVVVNPGSALGVGSVTLNSGQLEQYATGGIAGAASTLTVLGGSAELHAPNAYGGATTIQGGQLSIDDDTDLGAAGSTLAINGGTFLANASLTVARPVLLGSAASVDVASGNAATLTGSIGAVSSGASLTKGPQAGTLILAPSTPQTLSLQNLSVTGGALYVTPGAGGASAANVAGALTVSNGASLVLSTGTQRMTHSVGSLVVGATSTVDVGSQLLQLGRGAQPATNAASVVRTTYQHIISAYNSPNPLTVPGDWTGAGITSALARADAALPAGSRAGLAVGVWDSTDAQLATGQPASTVRVAVTTVGDANGDGFTDNADFAIWRNNYGTRNTYWSHGDYNYDGFVDNADFALWRNNYGNRLKIGTATAAPSLAAAAAGPVTLTGSAAQAAAAPALTPFPTAVPTGKVAASIDPNTGHVLVDINLQGQADLQGVQFASTTDNAFVPANYQGMQAHGFSPAWLNSGPSQTATLIGEINQNGQTSFPTEVVYDFGNFWNLATDARDLQFTYNTVVNGVTSSNVGAVSYIAVPEPSVLALAALAATGVLGRRRRHSAPKFLSPPFC
jgi:autotransporter-associated beta strand protein